MTVRADLLKRELSDKIGGHDVIVVEGMDSRMEKLLLGYILGFSWRQGVMKREKCKQVMKDLGMHNDDIPGEVTPEETFKDVMQRIRKTTIETFPEWGNVRVEYETRKLSDEEYVLVRRIFGQEDESSTNKKVKRVLRHDNLLRISLMATRESDSAIMVTWYDDEAKEFPHASRVKQETTDNSKATFEMLEKNYTNDQLRSCMYRMLQRCRAIPYNAGGGGVWFVPKAFDSDLQKWKEFMKLFAENSQGSFHRRYGSSMRVLPCIDSKEQREWVAEDVRRQTEAQFKQMLENTLEQLKECKPENIERILANRLETKKESKEFLEEYAKMLKMKLTHAIEVPKIDKDIESRLSGRAKALWKELTQL